MNCLLQLRAAILTTRGRMADAARLYREVLEREPAHNPGLLIVLADCRQRGAVDRAIDIAERALQIEPNHFVALQTLGWAHVLRGNHGAARPVIARALAEYRRQRLADSPRVLGSMDAAVGLISRLSWLSHRAQRSSSVSLAERAAEPLKAWKDWAEQYVGSGS